MSDVTALLSFARYYFIAVGLVLIAGGLMGFLKARSVASLIAGGVSGLLLILSAILFAGHLQSGLVLALLVCLALAGRFVPALLRGKLMPAGYVAPLALIGVIVALYILLHPAVSPAGEAPALQPDAPAAPAPR
jgi:uncharacterized membrane protein (UPF0136 family)